MSITYPRPRVLPVTILAMALLMTLKSVGLLRAVLAGSAVAAETPAISAPEAAAAQAQAATAAAPAARTAPPAGAGMAAPPATNVPLPTASAPPPPVSEAERSLLLDLRHRRDMLDTRARAQEQRDAVMVAAEKKLAARVAELNALQAKLEALEAARQSHDSANWTSLVHIYETMKPRDAATIFDALDMQVLLGVLDRMSERKAAPILAAMQPDRARLATQLLAELRTRSVTPAGEPPAAGPAGSPGAPLSSPNVSEPKG
jgi:flagellar motility protein MotE (MotC chaperone)